MTAWDPYGDLSDRMQVLAAELSRQINEQLVPVVLGAYNRGCGLLDVQQLPARRWHAARPEVDDRDGDARWRRRAHPAVDVLGAHRAGRERHATGRSCQGVRSQGPIVTAQDQAAHRMVGGSLSGRTSMTQTLRRDKLPAKQSLGGTPPGSPPAATPVGADWRPGIKTWHELIATGPKGDPQKTTDRRAELGQLVIHYPFKVEPLPGNAGYAPREDLRAIRKGRGAGEGGFGRLVLHSLKPLAGAEREAHRAPRHGHA